MERPGMGKQQQNWFERKMPRREDMERNRWLAPIAHRFTRSDLWRFTRRSVPRGAALGLFAAFIIPFGQIFLAAFLALPMRANVPVAALITFVTNPFTVPFWAWVANRVGHFVLKIDAATGGSMRTDVAGEQWAWARELFQTVGVTAFGFVVLSIVTAAIGYLVSSFGWRFLVARKWTRRPARRKVLTPAE
jgi:uncharacterized protein (DUF2062 family)